LSRLLLEHEQYLIDATPEYDPQRKQVESQIFNEILTLWQTDEIRDRKPTVIDEVRNGLFYFDETLFDVLTDIYGEVERCLNKYFPDTDIDTILAKGRAAYASGSRPTVTGPSGPEQWAYARLASVLTGGKALAVDKDLVGPKSLKVIYRD
jgi:hypothetical protein